VFQKLLLFGLLIVSLSALGQSNYAVLNGSVTDPESRSVAGATIELAASSTGAIRRVLSNQQGLFEVSGLSPDEYTMKVTAHGFAPLTKTVRLEVAQKMTINAALTIEPVKESLEVTAREVLKTTDASLGEVVEPRSVRELPLNGRMLIDLVLTVPGAHVSHGAQAGDMNPLYWRPGQRSAVSVGGNRVPEV